MKKKKMQGYKLSTSIIQRNNLNLIYSKEFNYDSEILGIRGSWRDITDSARTTVNKEAGKKEPSSNWKRRMLLCEHSPIRNYL